MDLPGLKEQIEDPNTKKDTKDEKFSAFKKLKKIFKPENEPGGKKKFGFNIFKVRRSKKFYEPPLPNALPQLNQILIAIPNQPQAPKKETEIKPESEQPKKFVFPEIEPKIPEEPIDVKIEQKIPEETKDVKTEQKIPEEPKDEMKARTPTLMPVNMLSNLPYSDYSQAEYSQKAFYNISAYGFNSYSGTEKEHNEDRIKVIVNYQKTYTVNNKQISPNISYFGIFDGHGGDACSNFLKDKLDSFIFNSKFFPAYPIQAIKDGFAVAENTFMREAIDKDSNVIDKSGSCACVILIINDTLYAINLGDSRALLSSNSGQTLTQITRDHKPNDPSEKERIENAGASVFYANVVIVDGNEVILKESDFGEGFKFPYRINPGGMCVSFIL